MVRWMFVVAMLAPSIAMAEDKAKLAGEYTAKLSIDQKPGGKDFQGVWLQLEGRGADKPGGIDPSRLLIDYRPRELWRGFEGQRVTVRGNCFHKWGQAIAATHFEVERLKLAGKPTGDAVVPFLEIGPKILLAGELVAHAGSKELVFRSGTTTYAIAGKSVDKALVAGRLQIEGRTVVVNPKLITSTVKDHLWITELLPSSYVPEKEGQDRDEPYLCK